MPITRLRWLLVAASETLDRPHQGVRQIQSRHNPFACWSGLARKSARSHRMDTEKLVNVTRAKPRVVVEIAMNEWTPGDHLRHAKFKRLRDDKKVSDVSPYPASV